MRRGCDRGEKKVKNGFYLQRAVNNYVERAFAGIKSSYSRRRFVLRVVKGIGSCQQMACREPTDAAQGPEDGAQRDGGCCAGGRQVLRRTTADGLRGGVARGCAGCCRWFVASWQVARRESKNAAPEASG